MKIKNPILKGFNPDPSLLRVGDDYYIATSTFEWFPAVSIYHSKNLADWELITHALNDEKQLNMKGIDTSCGIWAPNLTYSDGVFYLMYTIVYTNRARYKDTYNYLTISKNVYGPWSDGVFINSSGFDPSLFHDDDGKKYVVNMVLDYRLDKNRFAGIDIQEYNEKSQKLIGTPTRIFSGTNRGTTEGPNILKRNGWYYLVCAEGGTSYGHCSIVLRSKNIYGPYEESPFNPIITSSNDPQCQLQRAGHMQLMETKDGHWYAAHLCSRPVEGFSILGRETAIQNIVWQDDWCMLESGSYLPNMEFTIKDNNLITSKNKIVYDFHDNNFPLDFYTLREDFETNKITIKNNKLLIEGGCSIASKYNQGLIARRVDSFNCDFKVSLEFEPKHYRHIAGLIVYYNYDNSYEIRLTKGDIDKNISVVAINNGVINESDVKEVQCENISSTIYLKAKIRKENVEFYFSIDDVNYTKVGDVYDMKKISDEYIEGNGFTGAMVGVNCMDLQGDGCTAEFDFLEYERFC
ncbi:MAG: glycoside hydrolase family 43 protein [Lachnospirales bacterium]